MESLVVDENSFRVGDDGVEEMSAAEIKDLSSQKSEQEVNRNSIGTSLVDSLKRTVESVTESLPASLGGSVDHGEGSGSTILDHGRHSDVKKEVPRQTVGDNPVRADEKVLEVLSLEGTITDGAADEWSVVDPCPEVKEEEIGEQAQLESQTIIVQEEEEIHEVGDHHLSMEAQRTRSSDVTAEPKIQEENSYSIAFPSGHLGGNLPYVPSSFLRRRPRSYIRGDACSSQVSESGDISALAEDRAAFQPLRYPLAEDEAEDPVSKIEDLNELTADKEPEVGSGYDPEVEGEVQVQVNHGSGSGSTVLDHGKHSDVEKEAPRQTVGDNPVRANERVLEDLSLGGAITDGAADEWSVVDTCPEVEEEEIGEQPQLESQTIIVQEEEEIHEVGDHLLSMQAQSTRSSIYTAEPEIQEENSYSIASPSGHLGENLPYVPSSSLRRRPRSYIRGDACSSQVSESGDISALAEDRAAFQPLRYPLAEDEAEDPVSKMEDLNELTRDTEPEVSSGYDPEVEDGDNDGSSVSSREANDEVNSWRSPSQREDRWEEISSSSGLPGEASIHETRQRREVYRMPGSDTGGEENGDALPELLAEPAGFMVQAVEFQLNLIVHIIAICIWLANFTISTVSHPISRTVAVKDRVTNVTTGAANQVLEVFSFFGDGVSQAGPTMGKLSKKTFWGCLRLAYVMCILGLLLIPALFVDIVVVNTFVQEPVVIRHTLDFDFTQPKPVAVLPLFSKKEMERIESIPAHKTVKTRIFPVGRKFHITVILTLPESDYNMKLGMFQVTAETLSARDKVILRSSKPCRVRFKSLPIQLVNSLIYAVPHLVGLAKEAQTLQIRILEAQETVVPTASVRIFLEPKATVGSGVPEIYEALVRVESSLPWTRAMMRSCKWLFFVWNGGCLFLFEVGIVFCCCRGVLIPSFGRKSVAEDEIVQGEVIVGKEIVQGEVKDDRATRDGTKSSRRARSNRRVYFEDDIPGAAGTQDRRITRTIKNEEKANDTEGSIDDKDTPA